MCQQKFGISTDEEENCNMLPSYAVPGPNMERLEHISIVGGKLGVAQPALRVEFLGLFEEFLVVVQSIVVQRHDRLQVVLAVSVIQKIDTIRRQQENNSPSRQPTVQQYWPLLSALHEAGRAGLVGICASLRPSRPSCTAAG